MATDGPITAVPPELSPLSMHESTISTPSGDHDAGLSPSSGPVPNDSGGAGAEPKANGKGGSASTSSSNSSSRALKLPATLAQVWKDDFDSGSLLVSLSELFGEPLLPFVPFPELSLFL